MEQRKIHAVGLETLMKPKSLGEIGLRNLEDLNNVCLIKLGWQIVNKANDLWCSILRRKYEVKNNDFFMSYRGINSSLWKEIIKNIPEMPEFGSWSVGDEKLVNAWTDNWLGKDVSI